MEQPTILNFTCNYNNKLQCPVFSSLRMRNDRKYKQGHHYSILLKDQLQGIATCIYIRHFELLDLPTATAFLDTGYNKEDTIEMIKKMYKHKNINVFAHQWSFLLFKFESRC